MISIAGRSGLLAMLAIGVCLLRPYAVAQTPRCSNPNRVNGYCVSIFDCPSLLDIVSNTPLTTSHREFLVASQCPNGFGRRPHVCCTRDQDFAAGGANTTPPTPAPVTPVTTPTTAPTSRPAQPSNGQGNVLPVPPVCGQMTLANKIYNGDDTELDEFSWMALLEYVERNGRRTLNCAGSLINQRYVLTAGHCVAGAILTEIGPLSRIRLGEYDISQELDCLDTDCNDKVLELDYELVIPHPEFNPATANRYHDIALIRLAADVAYTGFIRPVCLPQPEGRAMFRTGELLTAAGWGRTLLARQSNIKQKLNIALNDHAQCSERFRTRNITLIPAQICLGGEFSKDTCDGDSGGPLMRVGAQQRWVLEGVVSFGYRCGLEGWPGVYTRVADYMDWIRATLRP